MTAMRNESASPDSIKSQKQQQPTNIDRKFAFLTQVTRPDYRSLPGSRSSIPSTPVSIPYRHSEEHIIFREVAAPIATPEDELLEDLEIKSEPILSPRQSFEKHEEKENVMNDDDWKSMEMTSFQEEKEENVENSTQIEEKSEEIDENPQISDENAQKVIEIDEKTEEIEENAQKSPEIHEKAIEIPETHEEYASSSYGEPCQAVLETVYDTTEEDDNMTDNERRMVESSEDEEEYETRSMLPGSSNTPDMMWNYDRKEYPKEDVHTPNIKLDESEPTTSKRAEFYFDFDDNQQLEDDPTLTSSGDEGVLQQSLLQLQKQLRKTDVRCSRLEKICEYQQKDIDSLRYEVDWKDKRIEYLQKTLEELETKK